MLDLNNMHQISSSTHRIPPTRLSTFLVVLICFIVFLLAFATCVMCISYLRRRMKKRESFSLIGRSETSETIIESTLINNNTMPTMYSAIDV